MTSTHNIINEIYKKCDDYLFLKELYDETLAKIEILKQTNENQTEQLNYTENFIKIEISEMTSKFTEEILELQNKLRENDE